MENTWILGLLGSLSLFMSMACHMQIAQAETKPYAEGHTLGLKIERFAFALFGLVFFAVLALR